MLMQFGKIFEVVMFSNIYVQEKTQTVKTKNRQNAGVKVGWLWVSNTNFPVVAKRIFRCRCLFFRLFYFVSFYFYCNSCETK